MGVEEAAEEGGSNQPPQLAAGRAGAGQGKEEKGSRRRSAQVEVHNRAPLALGFEDDFDGFTDRARAFGPMRTAGDVVKAGLKALDGRGGLMISGLLNKLSVFLQRFAPRGLVTRIAGNLYHPRADS